MNISKARVESDDLTVERLFEDWYVVPSFQREFTWEQANVEQLFSDILGEFDPSEPEGDSEYFVGSIVACEQSDRQFALIDGQQRVTTFYIMVCAIRDRLRELGESELSALQALVAHARLSSTGADEPVYRLVLQYEDSQDVLLSVASGDGLPKASSAATKSVTNLRTAYSTVRNLIANEFGDDSASLRGFLAHLVRNVKVVRITTSNVSHALKVFETINARGERLGSMDLLKNLMFMKAEDREYEKLKEAWKKLADTLYAAEKKKQLRFFKYYILSHYEVPGSKLREDEIYDWFLDNEELCGYSQDPTAFVKQLLECARTYTNFLNGRDQAGQSNRYLQNLKFLSGSARQHLILLLAGRHLEGEQLNTLCKEIENLFFTFMVTREVTREFERRFVLWAEELRAVESDEDLALFLNARFAPEKRRLAERFGIAFRDMHESEVLKYKLSYILGKLAQHLDEEASGGAKQDLDLGTFINSKVEIEHVLPQSPSQQALEEFDDLDELEKWIGRLGNLTLAEKSINCSAGNGKYSEKQPKYDKSRFLMTRALSGDLSMGKDTKFNRAVKKVSIGNRDRWTSCCISERQAKLLQLARLVWGVPEQAEEK